MRRLAILSVVGWSLAWTGAARADCGSEAHLSTCFDADTLWPHPGPGTFTFIGASTTAPPGTFALGLFATYVARPVVLVLPSADPKGTEVAAVDHLADATFLFSLGLTKRLEAGVALPVVAYRTGLGVSALTSQHATDISHGALRDPRIGAAYRLLGSPYGVMCPDAFAMVARFELSLPVGDETSFAGDAAPVAIPSVSGEARRGPFALGFEAGARVRKTADLAGSRVGSQLSIALGLAADLFGQGKLGVAVEAMALPTLVAQNALTLDPASGDRVPTASRAPLVPAEWQASLRSTGVLADGVSLSLGAGTPLLFTGESGITSPRYRVTLGVRYSPSP